MKYSGILAIFDVLFLPPPDFKKKCPILRFSNNLYLLIPISNQLTNKETLK